MDSFCEKMFYKKDEEVGKQEGELKTGLTIDHSSDIVLCNTSSCGSIA